MVGRTVSLTVKRTATPKVSLIVQLTHVTIRPVMPSELRHVSHAPSLEPQRWLLHYPPSSQAPSRRFVISRWDAPRYFFDKWLLVLLRIVLVVTKKSNVSILLPNFPAIIACNENTVASSCRINIRNPVQLVLFVVVLV